MVIKDQTNSDKCEHGLVRAACRVCSKKELEWCLYNDYRAIQYISRLFSRIVKKIKKLKRGIYDFHKL